MLWSFHSICEGMVAAQGNPRRMFASIFFVTKTSQSLSRITYPSHVTCDKCGANMCVGIVIDDFCVRRRSSWECVFLWGPFCAVSHVKVVLPFVSAAAAEGWVGRAVVPSPASHVGLFRYIRSRRATGSLDTMPRVSVDAVCCDSSHCWATVGTSASLSSSPPLSVLILTHYQTSRLKLQWLLERLQKCLLPRTFWGSSWVCP